VAIDTPGTVIYPFSNMFIPPDPDYLSNVPGISIRIYAESPEFSVTLDRIDLIPEPGVALLLGLGGAWLVAGWRRRRPAMV
jgi:hypothetical protein